jgi:hypothetical protein
MWLPSDAMTIMSGENVNARHNDNSRYKDPTPILRDAGL